MWRRQPPRKKIAWQLSFLCVVVPLATLIGRASSFHVPSASQTSSFTTGKLLLVSDRSGVWTSQYHRHDEGRSTTATAASRMIMMAKGDGKRKRKKQSSSSSLSSSSPSPPPSNIHMASSSSSSPSVSSFPPPMRVSNGINIPIRRQIQYAKLNKQFREQQSTSSFRQSKVMRTKYRRTWDDDEIQQKAEERKRKGQNPNWDVVLNQTKAAPLVLVDGYNIIQKWPRLKKHMVKGDIGRARQLLVDDLENLRSLKGWRIEVVFDGAGRIIGGGSGGPLGDSPRGQRRVTAADRATTKDVSKHGVRTVYTGSGVEADSYIEARCAEAKNVTSGLKTGTFIVATDDAMIRIAGESAGALCMSAERFVNELKATKKAMEYRVEAAMAKVNGHALRPEKLWGTNTFGLSRPRTSNSQGNGGRPKPINTDVGNTHSNYNNSTIDTSNPTSTTATTASSTTSSSTSSDTPVKGAEIIDDGKFVYKGRFGRGSLLIEDKRKKPKT